MTRLPVRNVAEDESNRRRDNDRGVMGTWVGARSTSRSLSDTSGVGGPVWGRGDVLCQVVTGV